MLYKCWAGAVYCWRSVLCRLSRRRRTMHRGLDVENVWRRLSLSASVSIADVRHAMH